MPHALRGCRRHGPRSSLAAGEVEGWLAAWDLQGTVVAAGIAGLRGLGRGSIGGGVKTQREVEAKGN